MQSKADAGESEEGDGANVVKQHRGDQSSRRAALRVASRKPACDTQGKQPGPADPCHDQGGGRLQRRTDQEHNRCRGETQQRQTSADFNPREKQHRTNERNQHPSCVRLGYNRDSLRITIFFRPEEGRLGQKEA